MTNADIVQKMADGYTAKEIADEFGLSVNALRKKIYTLRKMCNCYTSMQLVAVYFRKKLIE